MATNSIIDDYIKIIGLKPFKTTEKFLTSLTVKTDKTYAKEVANQLNDRAKGVPISNKDFYELKNKTLAGSLVISSAFDSGVFRKVANTILNCKDYFRGNVLDIGCDCGVVTCFMAKAYPQCNFVGVDINGSAVENAKELADKLKLDNVEFKCADAYSLADEKYSVATSFRALLDVTEAQTKSLAFFGERKQREDLYCKAFEQLAMAVSNSLEDNGLFISIERYTAEYGLLGWFQALSNNGINAVVEKCKITSAMDIASKKDYSVSIFLKNKSDLTALDVFDQIMSRDFKSGRQCDGAMAEFALYKEAVGEIEFTDVFKKDRLIHQFAFAKTESQYMCYDASATKRRLTYYNDSKKEYVDNDYKSKLNLYNNDNLFSIITYKINKN